MRLCRGMCSCVCVGDNESSRKHLTCPVTCAVCRTRIYLMAHEMILEKLLAPLIILAKNKQTTKENEALEADGVEQIDG